MRAAIFAVDIDQVARFVVGQVVDDVDRHNAPIRGRVGAVKEGNRVALVIVEIGTDEAMARGVA